ncbi:uncharacterized protein LOC118411585 isoform X2 [Branchiostoma floridae]|nr:uncharacterized protein LOC118411585 isoform X2 [Branchiostoma floridae]XP_035669900.1 uncharacterized protein LOC118411585 isoform X2 [Branchiostoma floridae]XP_035669901.1 uncharacterized protein LOC118411585 isoform X2 [Branchiostoma floridae]
MSSQAAKLKRAQASLLDAVRPSAKKKAGNPKIRSLECMIDCFLIDGEEIKRQLSTSYVRMDEANCTLKFAAYLLLEGNETDEEVHCKLKEAIEEVREGITSDYTVLFLRKDGKRNVFQAFPSKLKADTGWLLSLGTRHRYDRLRHSSINWDVWMQRSVSNYGACGTSKFII